MGEPWMNNMVLVDQTITRILAGDVASAMRLVAEDAELVLLPAESHAAAETVRGRARIRQYFESLGAIPTFWQVHLVPEGDRILVLGRESYSTNAGLESDTEFMLVFQVEEEEVSRIVAIENLAAEAPLLPTVYRGWEP